MRRREFIILPGASVAIPLVARAQQSDRIRRIGVIGVLDKDDPEAKARMAVFQQALAALGWIEGVNVRIDYRWAGGDMDRVRKYATQLVALGPLSFWRKAVLLDRCSRQHQKPFRSCSRTLSIRSAAVLSRVCPIRGVMLPGLPSSKPGQW